MANDIQRRTSFLLRFMHYSSKYTRTSNQFRLHELKIHTPICVRPASAKINSFANPSNNFPRNYTTKKKKQKFQKKFV